MKLLFSAVLAGVIGASGGASFAQSPSDTSDYLVRLSPDRPYVEEGEVVLFYGQVDLQNGTNRAGALSAMLKPKLGAGFGAAAPQQACIEIGTPGSSTTFTAHALRPGNWDYEADADFFSEAGCAGPQLSANYDIDISTLTISHQAVGNAGPGDGGYPVEEASAEEEYYAEPDAAVAEPEVVIGPNGEEISIEDLTTTAAGPAMDGEAFVAEMTLPNKITIPGPTVIMQVMIRGENARSSIDDGERFDTTNFTVHSEESAKVTPIAPDFEMEPKEYECMALDADGTTATFKLTPIRSGEFEIGADIKLYNSADCSGTVVNKSIEPLAVLVEVDGGEWTKRFASNVFESFIGGFLNFWEMAIAAFFGLLLIFFRKKIMALLGLSKKDVEDADST